MGNTVILTYEVTKSRCGRGKNIQSINIFFPNVPGQLANDKSSGPTFSTIEHVMLVECSLSCGNILDCGDFFTPENGLYKQYVDLLPVSITLFDNSRNTHDNPDRFNLFCSYLTSNLCPWISCYHANAQHEEHHS